MNEETTKAFIGHLDDALIHIDDARGLNPDGILAVALKEISFMLLKMAKIAENPQIIHKQAAE